MDENKEEVSYLGNYVKKHIRRKAEKKHSQYQLAEQNIHFADKLNSLA